MELQAYETIIQWMIMESNSIVTDARGHDNRLTSIYNGLFLLVTRRNDADGRADFLLTGSRRAWYDTCIMGREARSEAKERLIPGPLAGGEGGKKICGLGRCTG